VILLICHLDGVLVLDLEGLAPWTVSRGTRTSALSIENETSSRRVYLRVFVISTNMLGRNVERRRIIRRVRKATLLKLFQG
jgi:hypothetical protein